MELERLGMEYLETAARVSLALKRARAGDGPEAREERRILAGMLRELREVGGYAIHYRERGYCRNGIGAAWPER